MEVAVPFKKPDRTTSSDDRTSLISFQKNYTQPALLPGSQEPDKSGQTKPLSLETDNDASDLQAAIEDAQQDTDLESLALVIELLEK